MSRILSVCVVPMIRVSYTEGEGTEKDPVRRVEQYWDKEGKLIAVKDPVKKEKE